MPGASARAKCVRDRQALHIANSSEAVVGIVKKHHEAAKYNIKESARMARPNYGFRSSAAAASISSASSEAGGASRKTSGRLPERSGERREMKKLGRIASIEAPKSIIRIIANRRA